MRHGTLKLPPASFTSALAPATILVYVQTAMNKTRVAKYTLGQVVRHRLFPFRGVVFDIDPEFNNTEEWYQSIPAEVRPRKDQPFYHLFAENAESEYVAYVRAESAGGHLRRASAPSAGC